jgi:hypothetical protein
MPKTFNGFLKLLPFAEFISKLRIVSGKQMEWCTQLDYKNQI